MAIVVESKCPVCGHILPAAKAMALASGVPLDVPWVYVKDIGGRGHIETKDRIHAGTPRFASVWQSSLGRILRLIEFLVSKGVLSRVDLLRSRVIHAAERMMTNWEPIKPKEIFVGHAVAAKPGGISDVSFGEILSGKAKAPARRGGLDL